MKVLVTGATGFVGRQLLKHLDDVVVLSRNAARASESLGGVPAYDWDADREPPPAAAFSGVDCVIHLAGEPVAEGRWTEQKKQRIRDSRVLGTRHLVDALAGLEQRPAVLVSASAVGWYGDRGDQVLAEAAAAATDFLGEVCQQWETEAARAETLGLRTVQVRFGIVLGTAGGALKQMLPIFKLGVGGRLGSGKQWMPWVHVGDLVNLLLFVAETDELRGPVNGTAPEPVTNREFTKTLADLLHRPAILPAPAWGLRLALGEFADSLLASQRVIPQRAEAAGFTFQFRQLKPALRDLLASKP